MYVCSSTQTLSTQIALIYQAGQPLWCLPANFQLKIERLSLLLLLLLCTCVDVSTNVWMGADTHAKSYQNLEDIFKLAIINFYHPNKRRPHDGGTTKVLTAVRNTSCVYQLMWYFTLFALWSHWVTFVNKSTALPDGCQHIVLLRNGEIKEIFNTKNI